VVALPLVLVTSSSRSPVAFPSTAKSHAGHFRCGCTSSVTGVITYAMLRLAQG